MAGLKSRNEMIDLLRNRTYLLQEEIWALEAKLDKQIFFTRLYLCVWLISVVVGLLLVGYL